MKYISGSVEFANTVPFIIDDTLTANTLISNQLVVAETLIWNSDTDTYERNTGFATDQKISPSHTKMRRCVLNDAGSVVYYLNSANSALKADGTLSNLSGADGQVMVEIPQVFIKYSNTGNTHSWSISDVPLPGYELHPAHIVDGNVVQYRYIGAYDACVANTISGLYESGLNYYNNVTAGLSWNVNAYKLSSVSGIYPAVGLNRADARLMAANRGNRWRQLDFHLLSLIQLLYLIEYGSFNSQSKISNGNVGCSYTASSGSQTDSPHSISGKSNTIGNASGGVYSTARDTAWVSYRGIENFWGNCWTWIDGINFNSALVYVNTNNSRSTYADDTSTGYTLIGSKIQSNGYPIRILGYKAGFIPTLVGGSSSTYLCDYYWQNTGWRALLFGGDAVDGVDAGAFYVYSYDAFSLRYRDVGSRLAY